LKVKSLIKLIVVSLCQRISGRIIWL